MKPSEILIRMREKNPVVHCIGNDISTAETAHLLLAAGARPVMTAAFQETEEVSRHSAATVLNCGTPSEEKFTGLKNAAKGSAGHPVVTDPVGAGASAWRKKKTEELLSFTAGINKNMIIHCNYSEAVVLISGMSGFEGVDSADSTLADRIKTAQSLSGLYRCTAVISGRQDVVCCGEKTAVIHGGSPVMKLVSGSGCMLGGLLGAFATVADSFDSSVAACVFWKKCAESAAQVSLRPGSFRIALTDAACLTQAKELEDIKVEYL